MSRVTFGGGDVPHETFGASPNGGGEAILPDGGDGRVVEFTLNGEPYRGRLPLLPRAMALAAANNDAVDRSDGMDHVCINAAALAMAHTSIASMVGHWRRVYKRDVIEYGEAVLDALMQRGMSLEDISDSGAEVKKAIFDSIPSAEEVDEEREDFTDRPPDSSDETPEGAEVADAPE